MKKIIKRLMGCVFGVASLVLAIAYTGKLLNPAWTDDAMHAVEAFHSLPEDSVEVIVYGSSHAWKGLDSREMYEKYGISVYNYGCNWQHINTTSLFLQDSLRTQSPKVVLIETYRVAEILDDVDMNGEIYYTKAIPSFSGKKDYLRQCFGNNKDRYLSYYIPLIMFHSNWNNIGLENFSEGKTIEDYLNTMGYETSSEITPITFKDYTKVKQHELSDDSIEILDSMVSICKKNNIDIIFYTVPYEGVYRYSKAMEKYAKENGCVYLNLFEKIDEIEFNEEKDFRDATHLNDSGAGKVADYLGEYIVNHYEIS